MHIGVELWRWCVAALVCGWCGGVRGDAWRWPDADAASAEPRPAASHRIDSKVRFVDTEKHPAPPRSESENSVLADEVPFREPTDTEGFYNRPPGVGRYPVRVEQPGSAYRPDPSRVYPVRAPQQPVRSDRRVSPGAGTLDELRYCQCVSEPDCVPRNDVPGACGAGKFLCCYGPGQHPRRHPEYFNEVEERPLLVPGPGPEAFPAPNSPSLGSSAGPADSFRKHPGVLVGPQGPTGNIGPPQRLPVNEKYIEPLGPTGAGAQDDVNSAPSAQRGVLVGPGGPTGIIGPGYQRPVLVGPGSPTGIIGPNRSRNGILVGPGGPTGIIGPYGYGGRRNPGVLVGPGGPTGVIGPRRYYGK